MEQVELLESTCLMTLQDYINRFMSTLHEDVDIIDMRIDSHYHDVNKVWNVPKLIAIIRYRNYEQHNLVGEN